MWISVKEYVTVLGRWGWLVVVDIALGVVGGYLDVTEQSPVAEWSFPLWAWLTIALVGLIVGPFFAFHKVKSQRDQKERQIHQLEDTQPVLTVTDIRGPDDREGLEAGYLRIHNNGASCYIQAQAQIIGGELERTRLRDISPIPWRNIAGPSVLIEKGGELILGIQAQMLKDPGIEPQYEYQVQFERLGGAPDAGLAHESTGWSPTPESPKCIIRVTITSTPSILGEVLPYHYELGLTEDGVLIWKPVQIAGTALQLGTGSNEQ